MEAGSQRDRDAPPSAALPGPSSPGPPLPGPSQSAAHPASAALAQLPDPASFSGAELLPRSWRESLPEEQHEWLGQAMFTRDRRGQPSLTKGLRLWWFPPGDRLVYTQPPASAHEFFQSPFFLWMPYRMWACKLVCPSCGHKLTRAGLYRTVRRVLDISTWYFMGTEYLECRWCHKKVAAWDKRVLEQLEPAHRERFPAVLMYRLSCDKKVVRLLMARTIGNSASRLHNALVEQHTWEWMTRSMSYLSALRKFHAVGAAPQQRCSLPAMHPVPAVSSLQAVYMRTATSRLTETKARVTSIFGNVLKMGSTKKLTKKLVGVSATTSITNVGNEHGQVLISVLTTPEEDGLLPLAAGLVRRYKDAGKDPPQILYVNQDCCSSGGQGKVAAMFAEWDQLAVRLDVSHFMRCFIKGLTSINHQHYGMFMERLSSAIFEWDSIDVQRLKGATASEEMPAKQLDVHCRHHTRGPEETERLIQELLDSVWEAADNMGVPLVNRGRMEEVWSTQRRHLPCIQDPEGVELYRKTGEVTRGGVRLPVYRCARGTSSLDLFHSRLCHFIPGPSVSPAHFQVYLLEGLVRWNEDRARAAAGAQRTKLRCYNYQMQQSFSRLCQELLGETLVHSYTPPNQYTGELLGIDYLQQPAGQDPDGMVEEAQEELEAEEEEFQEEPEDLMFVSEVNAAPNVFSATATPAAPTSSVRPAAPTSSFRPAASTSSVRPAAPTSSVRPAAPTSSFRPAASTSSVRPAAPTSSVRPAAPTSSFRPAASTSSVRPAAPTSFKPAAPISSFKPAAPTSFKPAAPISSFKPAAPISSFKPAASTTSVRPAASTSSVRPAAPTSSFGPAASTSGSSAMSAASCVHNVPRSTAWWRRKREEEWQRGQEEGALLKKPRKTFQHFRCKRCGRPKTKEYGHSRYRGENFCSTAEGRSVGDWLTDKREEHKKTKVIQPVPQQVIQPVPQQAIQPVPQQAIQPVPQQAIQPVPQQAIQLSPYSIPEPDPQTDL